MTFENYRGLTHAVPYRLMPLWQRVMCRRQIHAFDEVASGTEHYLSCDACGLMVNIASIDDTYVEPRTPASRPEPQARTRVTLRPFSARHQRRMAVLPSADAGGRDYTLIDRARAEALRGEEDELMADLLDLMTPEQARIWWDSPQAAWNGQTPRGTLASKGPEALLEQARRITRGDYA